jgi:CopG family nickel-responsive transcriptional regulator
MNPRQVRRFSISMPAPLVDQLDNLVRSRGYANRSQAVADLVRSAVVERLDREGRREIAGTVTLVYDHHKRNLQARLTGIQHRYEGLIVAVMHVHLDHHNCMEVLAVRGRADEVRSLADRLATEKGVRHGRLNVTTTPGSLA